MQPSQYGGVSDTSLPVMSQNGRKITEIPNYLDGDINDNFMPYFEVNLHSV